MYSDKMFIEDSIINLESFEEKAPYKLEAIFIKWKKEKLQYVKGHEDIHLPKFITYLAAIGQRTMKMYIDYLMPFTPMSFQQRIDEIKRAINKTKDELDQWRRLQMMNGKELDGYYLFLLENMIYTFKTQGIDISKTPLEQGFNNLIPKIAANINIQDCTAKDENLMQTIHAIFGFMVRTDPRKHKDIVNEEDYQKLLEWTYSYFDNNLERPIIDDPINEVNTAKGNIIWAFKTLFNEIKPNNTMPKSLFDLYTSSFHKFRGDKFDNFKKQKKPQYFDSI